ncbi:hypothetical protein TRSC58_07439 [Trypanosoma rangeli SC58]|uniref:Uncharacterized protein n=1 Tax=Trypanosoma rangeli SC58 TaxID=429131 RepID=A0A061IT67_TRYRA|nr:hypothetical protein TRSC58_07439 [Trypanosoma rangeli SC58]
MLVEAEGRSVLFFYDHHTHASRCTAAFSLRALLCPTDAATATHAAPIYLFACLFVCFLIYFFLLLLLLSYSLLLRCRCACFFLSVPHARPPALAHDRTTLSLHCCSTYTPKNRV